MEVILKPGFLNEGHHRLNIPAQYIEIIQAAFNQGPVRLVLGNGEKEIAVIPTDNAVFQNHNAFNSQQINKWIQQNGFGEYEQGHPPSLVFELGVTLTFKRQENH